MTEVDNIISKKVKIFREQKFTKVRNPYKRYNKADFIWKEVFDEIDLLKTKNDNNFLKITSEKYGIKYKTLKNKYCNYKNGLYINEYDKNIEKYFDGEEIRIKNKIIKQNKEHRGGNNKILSDDDEKNIFLFLKLNFIDRHKMLCDEIIKLYAIKKCKELYPNKEFTASNGWCYIFKKKWNLSTVRCTVSKVATKIYTDEEITLFFTECSNALKEVGSDFFLI